MVANFVAGSFKQGEKRTQKKYEGPRANEGLPFWKKNGYIGISEVVIEARDATKFVYFARDVLGLHIDGPETRSNADWQLRGIDGGGFIFRPKHRNGCEEHDIRRQLIHAGIHFEARFPREYYEKMAERRAKVAEIRRSAPAKAQIIDQEQEDDAGENNDPQFANPER